MCELVICPWCYFIVSVMRDHTLKQPTEADRSSRVATSSVKPELFCVQENLNCLLTAFRNEGLNVWFYF